MQAVRAWGMVMHHACMHACGQTRDTPGGAGGPGVGGHEGGAGQGGAQVAGGTARAGPACEMGGWGGEGAVRAGGGGGGWIGGQGGERRWCGFVVFPMLRNGGQPRILRRGLLLFNAGAVSYTRRAGELSGVS